MPIYKVLASALLFSALFAGAAEPVKLQRDQLIGKWRGTDTNGLSCRVVFDKTRGQVNTFRGQKHLTTVHFWWNIDSTRTNVILGVNGSAHSLENGELQLRLRPVNTNIVAVRDVRLKRLD